MKYGVSSSIIILDYDVNYKNGDGYGCLIGLDSNGELRKQSDWGDFMRYPIDHIASDKEIDCLMRKIMYAEHITNY